jgi:hypothetical protein
MRTALCAPVMRGAKKKVMNEEGNSGKKNDKYRTLMAV